MVTWYTRQSDPIPGAGKANATPEPVMIRRRTTRSLRFAAAQLTGRGPAGWIFL